jgi:hypothetical protein
MRVLTLAFGLAALASSPALALTVQHAPPRPDLAQHLTSAQRPQGASNTGRLTFSASSSAYDRAGAAYSYGAPSYGTSHAVQFGGPLPPASSFIDRNFRQPSFDAPIGRRDTGNPLSLVPLHR